MLLIGKGAAGASALSWQPLIPILIPTIQVAWASDVRTWEQRRVQRVWEGERE